MKKIKNRAFMVLTLLLSLFFNALATDRAVPITFSVTSTGINRFIASQWSGMNFAASPWSGTYQGLAYNIQLVKPTIVLSTGTIKITLKMNITSSVNGVIVYNGSTTITPTLIVPSTTISASNVIAQYTDLQTQVQAITKFTDSRLKYAIEQALSPISWIVYQGKTLNESTTRLTETADISWKGIPTLTFTVTTDEINFTITPTITSNAPSYTYRWNRTENSLFGIKVISNNVLTFNVGSGRIYDIGGRQVANITPETVYPSTYNATTQKYETVVYYRADNSLPNTLTTLMKLNIKRSNMETLWSASFSMFGLQSTWTANATQLTAIRGE